jgi:NAD(P)-dependent dehydrogenase (short-subunit alcohol dehydrogenase family)
VTQLRAAATASGIRSLVAAGDRDSAAAAAGHLIAASFGLPVAAVELTVDEYSLNSVGHFRRVLEVNVIGAFLVARAGLNALTRPGAIVLNASVNALRPERLFLDYNASKAAVVSMAKTIALEESGQGVAVTALCPGYFPTRMTAGYLADAGTHAEILHRIPAGRTGRLKEIAQVVDFLLSPAAVFMTGSVVSLDGGASV